MHLLFFCSQIKTSGTLRSVTCYANTSLVFYGHCMYDCVVILF